jgi:hypothetical protein
VTIEAAAVQYASRHIENVDWNAIRVASPSYHDTSIRCTPRSLPGNRRGAVTDSRPAVGTLIATGRDSLRLDVDDCSLLPDDDAIQRPGEEQHGGEPAGGDESPVDRTECGAREGVE